MNQFTFIARARDIFLDNAIKRVRLRQERGRMIDKGHLALLETGDSRVLANLKERGEKDYHIDILIDASGSMSGSGKKEFAFTTAHALAYSLLTSGAKVKVYLFNRGFMESKGYLDLDILSKEYDVFKYQTCSRDLLYLNGNHDGYFVRLLAEQRISGRRIILVFSDGQPACDNAICGMKGCSDEDKMGSELMSAIAYARRKGIIMLSVGLLTDSPIRYYGKQYAITVNKLETLYKDTVALLRKYIKRG